MCVYVFIGLFCFVLFIKILFINLINLGIGILIVFIELYNWFFNLIKIKEFYKYKWFLC